MTSSNDPSDDPTGRLARLEEQLQEVTARLAALEQAAGPVRRARVMRGPGALPAPGSLPPPGSWAGPGESPAPAGPDAGEPEFTITGKGRLGGRRFTIRQRALLSDVLATDPEAAARVFSALASPARITVLRALLGGPRTSQQLRAELDDASVGQLYHHLRELLAAGLVIQPARSQYAVPWDVLVMLCVQLAAAGRLADGAYPPEDDEEEELPEESEA